jgi:hypothetical protein
MDIERRCACNTLLRIRHEHVGRRVRCPSCGRQAVWDGAPKQTVLDTAPKRNPLEDPGALAAAILAALKRHQ